ncbi:hypothetical protein MMC08_002457 [Hypocenomyce scalaris]|nr:hypothetical protein [Hypocenomyce scalaris]
MSFLHWICETYLARRRKKGKRKSVNRYWRDFKMLFRRANGERVDANVAAEVVKHWARDESILPTEDDRPDLPTTMLFQSYTGCRPAELVHAPRGRGLQDPLDEDTHDTQLWPDTDESPYDDENDYGNDNDDSGYTSAKEGACREILTLWIARMATLSVIAMTTTISNATLTRQMTQ